MLFCAPTVKNGYYTRWCFVVHIYINDRMGLPIREAEQPNSYIWYVCVCGVVCGFCEQCRACVPVHAHPYIMSVLWFRFYQITLRQRAYIQHNTSPSRPYGRIAITLSAFGGSTHSVRITKYYIHFHDMHHMSTCLVLIV